MLSGLRGRAMRFLRRPGPAGPRPDPEPLLLAAGRLAVSPSDCAYVGDSPFDMRAARAAGMHAVGVTWGRIHDRSRLEAEGPDAVVDTAEELLAVL